MHRTSFRTLIDLFVRLQTLHANPEDVSSAWALQEALIERIARAEVAMRAAKARAKAARAVRGARSSEPRNRKTARSMKRRVEIAERLIEHYRERLFVLRAVGDGIAFTYMTRWDIKPLSFKESSGFLTGKEGARHERGLWRELLRRGYVAILNDLTNSLRHGDITVPVDGLPLLIEVKRGEAANVRRVRQAEQLHTIGKYLSTDVTDTLYGLTGRFLRSESQSREVTHTDRLNEMIAELSESPTVTGEVEPGLYYVAVGPQAAEEERDAAIIAALRRCNAMPGVGLANFFKFAERGYYPFTLSIRDPYALYSFYQGQILIWVVIDGAVLRSLFERDGFSVEFDFDSETPITLTHPDWAGLEVPHMKVGEHIFQRIVAEFLSLRWFVENSVHMAREAFRRAADLAGESSEPHDAAASGGEAVPEGNSL
jgi:hypothetical protein